MGLIVPQRPAGWCRVLLETIAIRGSDARATIRSTRGSKGATCMKAQVLATSIESTEYMALQLADLEAVMTPEEREAALVKGWLIRGVEPGADEGFSFRIAAEYAPADIDQLIFQPLEIDCRSVTGRA